LGRLGLAQLGRALLILLAPRDLPEELLGGGDRAIVLTGVVIVFLLGVTFQGFKY
jgi:hypothetical protein